MNFEIIAQIERKTIDTKGYFLMAAVSTKD